MSKLLEVIVTSVEEAQQAQDGGADRLEVVRSFDQGGLTPPLPIVESILAQINIPVRVMVRENSTMFVSDDSEMMKLEANAAALSKLPINGMVAGFVRKGEMDEESLRGIISAAPHLPITFHRAFEHLSKPARQIETLKNIGAVDRILIHAGGRFTLPYTAQLQEQAENRITLIVGAGVDYNVLSELKQFPALREVHVGRAVREPATTDGKVMAARVAAIKKAIS